MQPRDNGPQVPQDSAWQPKPDRHNHRRRLSWWLIGPLLWIAIAVTVVAIAAVEIGSDLLSSGSAM